MSDSYEAAQQGINRHIADITSTRNWCVTGVLVYYGTIIGSSTHIVWWMCIPAATVVVVAALLTVYERGNGELMQRYCVMVEKALQLSGEQAEKEILSTPLLQCWMEIENKRFPGEKFRFFCRVAKRRLGVWVWMVILAVCIVVGTILGQVAT
jgi:hypothetical protein